MGSYVSGVINREFAFVQVSLSTPGFTSFIAQEFDFVYRQFRVALGRPDLHHDVGFLPQAFGILDNFHARFFVSLVRDIRPLPRPFLDAD